MRGKRRRPQIWQRGMRRRILEKVLQDSLQERSSGMQRDEQGIAESGVQRGMVSGNESEKERIAWEGCVDGLCETSGIDRGGCGVDWHAEACCICSLARMSGKHDRTDVDLRARRFITAKL